MTAPHIVDPARLLGEALAEASPDLMRSLLQTMINALLSADADAVVGAEYGRPTPGRTAQRNGYRHGIQQIPLALRRCEVPFIAAVNGPAVGAGCDLAMMCDLRIASTKAFFAESFVQLGIIPGDGGAWFLTRAIGPARAAEMALTGDRVDAATALEWGMVSRVVEPEDLLVAMLKQDSNGLLNRALRLCEPPADETDTGLSSSDLCAVGFCGDHVTQGWIRSAIARPTNPVGRP